MKTYQKIIFVILFTFLATGLKAQERANKWPVSKDVQKIYDRSEYTPTYVSSVGYPERIISKDVQRRSYREAQAKKGGNMLSTGYPKWTISKGVHCTKKVIGNSDYQREPRKTNVIVRQF